MRARGSDPAAAPEALIERTGDGRPRRVQTRDPYSRYTAVGNFLPSPVGVSRVGSESAGGQVTRYALYYVGPDQAEFPGYSLGVLQ